MKSKRILAFALSMAFVLCSFSACGDSAVPGEKNVKAVEEAPEAITLVDEKDKKAIEDVTAITGATNPDGKVIDSTGITDESGHKVYSTGQKDKSGAIIYTTGKKDSKGNILYTKNIKDSFGNLIYYSGTYDDSGKLVLTMSTESPDYTTNDTPSSPNIKSAVTTSTTLGAKESAKFTITDANCNFTKYFGGTSMDVFKDIDTFDDGGFVAVCTTQSTDGDLNGSDSNWVGSKNAVVKYSATGDVVWKYVIGGNNNLDLYSVAVLKDQTVVVAGYTTATDIDAKLNSKLISGAIARLDKDGKLMWTYSFPNDGNTNGEFIDSIAATPDGGFVVGGKSTSDSGFFKGANTEGSSAFIFKFDKNCNIKWRKTLYGSRSNTISALSVNKSGDIFATCVTTSYDGDFSKIDSSCTLAKNTVLLSLSKKGDLNWAEYLQGNGISEYNAVAATDDGGCVVAGSFTIGKKVSGIYTANMGESDGYILKYNSSGKVEWSKLFGGYKADYINSISVVDGGYVIAGQTESNTGDFLGQKLSKNGDGFIAYLNEKGQTSAVVVLNGNDVDNVLGTAVLSSGDVAICGTTISTDGAFEGSKASGQAKAFVSTYTAETTEKKQTTATTAK